MSSLREKAVRGTFWAFLERFGLQIVSFGVTIVLSRLLSPSDYGTLSMLGIITCVIANLVDSGFGQALVQRKDVTEIDYNSVFWFSVVASFLGYFLLYVSAPFVASFFGVPELRPILRVVSIALVFSAINSVQRAVLVKKMLFHLSFRISLSAAIMSACVGIVMAFKGYGPWALVFQGLTSSFVSVAVSWALIGWRPRFVFDFNSLKRLFGFGWKVTASFFLDQFVSNIYSVLIGKFYTRADLAFVDKGRSLPGSTMMAINSSIERVCYPVLAEMQEDHERFRCALRRMIKTSTFLVFPLMIGLAACSDTIVPLLFGDKWSPAVPFMQLVCVQFALRPFHSVNLRAILALGRSDIFFKLEIMKKIIGVALMLLSLPFGVMPFVLVSTLVGDPLCVVINAWPNRKLIGYTVFQQICDVMPSVVLTLPMGGVVYAMNWLPLPGFAILLFQIPVGAGLYFLLARVSRNDSLSEVVRIIVDRFSINIEHKRRG